MPTWRRGAAAQVHRLDAAKLPLLRLAADLQAQILHVRRRSPGCRQAPPRWRNRSSCTASRRTAGADTARGRGHAWLPAISSSSLEHGIEIGRRPRHALIFPRAAAAPGRPVIYHMACFRMRTMLRPSRCDEQTAHGAAPWPCRCAAVGGSGLAARPPSAAFGLREDPRVALRSAGDHRPRRSRCAPSWPRRRWPHAHVPVADTRAPITACLHARDDTPSRRHPRYSCSARSARAPSRRRRPASLHAPGELGRRLLPIGPPSAAGTSPVTGWLDGPRFTALTMAGRQLRVLHKRRCRRLSLTILRRGTPHVDVQVGQASPPSASSIQAAWEAIAAGSWPNSCTATLSSPGAEIQQMARLLVGDRRALWPTPSR